MSFLFDGPSARRVADTVRQRERDGRGDPPAPRGPRIAWPLVAVKVTQAIQPATSAGLGLGYGRFRDVSYGAGDVATWGDPYGDPVPVYTLDTTNPTAVGRTVVCGYLCGRLINILEICAS